MKLFQSSFLSHIPKDACKNNIETSQVLGITGKNGWWRREVQLDVWSTYTQLMHHLHEYQL